MRALSVNLQVPETGIVVVPGLIVVVVPQGKRI